MNNIVVFASGSGSNIQAIINAINEGRIHGRIAGLIASKEGIKAIERARINGIESYVPHSDNDVLEKVQTWSPSIIVLAGYLKKIPEQLVQLYKNRIINIHPSLLPKYGGKGFYGIHVHRAVIESGDTESGCTVHIVTEEYDDGPILAQSKIQVLPEYTAEDLAAAVLKEEHILLPQVIEQLINTESDLGTQTT